jgi:hypothetical protein
VNFFLKNKNFRDKIMLLNPFLLERAVAETRRRIPKNLGAKMKQKHRNAIKKASERLMENPYIRLPKRKDVDFERFAFGIGRGEILRNEPQGMPIDRAGQLSLPRILGRLSAPASGDASYRRKLLVNNGRNCARRNRRKGQRRERLNCRQREQFLKFPAVNHYSLIFAN